MDRTPYHRLKHRALTLTDYLAIDRTVLANERTALAYARTVLALVVVGGTCIKLFDAWYMAAIGIVFIAAALVFAVLGWRRFRQTQRGLSAALELHIAETEQTADPALAEPRREP